MPSDMEDALSSCGNINGCGSHAHRSITGNVKQNDYINLMTWSSKVTFAGVQCHNSLNIILTPSSFSSSSSSSFSPPPPSLSLSLIINNNTNETHLLAWFKHSSGKYRQSHPLLYLEHNCSSMPLFQRQIDLTAVEIRPWMYSYIPLFHLYIITCLCHVKDMQAMFAIIETWCNKWMLSVNLSKSQVVHFRQKSCTKTNHSFQFRSSSSNIVSQYRYLM